MTDQPARLPPFISPSFASRLLRALRRPKPGICKQCGKPFERSSDARYCSDRCSYNAYRDRIRAKYETSWKQYLLGKRKPRPPRPKRAPRR